MNQKLKFVTFASRDPHVLLLARNLAASVQAAGIDIPFEILSFDSDGCSEFGTSLFWELVMKKIQGVHGLLNEYDVVIHCDSDVVFLRNDMETLLNMGDQYDLIAQTDAPSEHIFSAGLFLATKRAQSLFDTSGVDSSYYDAKGFGDQGLINDRLKRSDGKLRPFLLSQSEYPNGWFWYRFYASLSPVAIHYNWIDNVPGKIEHMKQDGHWFLE